MRKQAEAALKFEIRLTTSTGVVIEVSSFVGSVVSEEEVLKRMSLLAAANAAGKILADLGIVGDQDDSDEADDEDALSSSQPADRGFPN